MKFSEPHEENIMIDVICRVVTQSEKSDFKLMATDFRVGAFGEYL